ncbi:MAG: sulfite exporter TauE/SafE family protein, partial [Actinomycetota bacterium]
MIPILTGFAAGGLHVFSGVDHLAALAPAAVENPQQAAKTGVYWGFGHGVGVLIIGGVGLVLRGLIDVEAWSGWAEFLVGFLLIGIGVWAIWRSRTLEIHDHPHEHNGDEGHHHLHAHDPGDKSHHHAALGVGIFHGMAGGGHLFGVLPALALPTAQAILYLLAYLVASVVAMSAFAYGVGVVSNKAGTAWIRRLMFGSGIVAIIVGLVWLMSA